MKSDPGHELSGAQLRLPSVTAGNVNPLHPTARSGEIKQQRATVQPEGSVRQAVTPACDPGYMKSPLSILLERQLNGETEAAIGPAGLRTPHLTRPTSS